MPEFIIRIVWPYGSTEHRCGDDERHTRRILAGLKGRHPNATMTVHRVGSTEDVSDQFAKKGA